MNIHLIEMLFIKFILNNLILLLKYDKFIKIFINFYVNINTFK